MFRRTHKAAHATRDTGQDTGSKITPEVALEVMPETATKTVQNRQQNGKPAEPVRTQPEPNRKGPSRRDFLKLTGVTLVAASLEACERVDTAEPLAVSGELPATEVPTAKQYPDVPYTPTEPPPRNILRVFTPHEARTVEALTARILPGTPDDPGAREAGVVTYIDNFLNVKDGLPEPTYREPPFARTYAGNRPPADTDGPYKVLWIPYDQIERYGYQSMLTPRDVYRIGVAATDRYANAQFGKDFVNLSETQQDSIIGAMAGGSVTSFDKELSAESFFHTLRRHTTEGMFSDPAYGGNRNLAGWKLVGYPGAQRAYLPSEIQTEGTARKPQAIADLSHFNPGQPANGEVILPVSGRDQQHSN